MKSKSLKSINSTAEVRASLENSKMTIKLVYFGNKC